MARTGFDPNEVIKWIPPGEENDEKPFTVLIIHVSYKMVQKYSKMIAARVAAQSKGMRDMARLSEVRTAAEEEVQKIQFCENVKGIRNYFVGGREITDAGEFYDKADTADVTEIIHAMESSAKLSEGQVKNSSGVSGGPSLPEAKTESPSTVTNAQTAIEKPETVTTGEDCQDQPAP